jgi:hypothetical protein
MAKISIAAEQSSGNLNFETAQKIIHQFLTKDRIKTALDDGRCINPALPNEPKITMKPYTKEELAKKLGITLEELEKLESPATYEKIAYKISLPLICLYCATKLADGKHKSE